MRNWVLVAAFCTASPIHAATETIGGFEVETHPYEISRDVDYVYPMGTHMTPEGWKPQPDIGLDAALPRAWPDIYINEYKQPFNPHAFFVNTAMLCNHLNATGEEETRTLLQMLFERFLEYTEERDGAAFVAYRFERTFRRVTVQPPWTSGYSSGAALIGLTLMSECADMDQPAQLAEKIVEGLVRPIDTNAGHPDLWVSFVDHDGYLWFEEMPLPQVEQPRILNGHNRTLTGLYWYWVHTGSEQALKLLKAGIKTIERYAPQFRNPGTINHYDLWQKRPDYGPERAINQQDVLYRMTGEPVFSIYRDVFEADMRDEIEAAKKND